VAKGHLGAVGNYVGMTEASSSGDQNRTMRFLPY